MTTVLILRDVDGRIARFESKGHAGADDEGFDIVCAGISAVLQSALLGLTDYLGLNVKSVMLPGIMAVTLPQKTSEANRAAAQAILETMLLGLRSIEAGHGGYLRIVEQEV